MKDTVLLVDEDKNQLQRCQEELGNEGYRVVTAEDMQAALDFIRSQTVDLVVLELEFSSGSGMDYLCDLKSKKPDVKVVVNSDHPEYKEDFHSWAADAFVTKSSDLSELKRTVRHILQGKS